MRRTLKISLDFLAGPLRKDEFIDGETRTGISVIDNDVALQALNDQICELYSSYYEFDSHDQACWFNEEQEKTDKPLMLELLGKLNARIAELNDGSFVVDDQERRASRLCGRADGLTFFREIMHTARGVAHDLHRADQPSDANCL